MSRLEWVIISLKMSSTAQVHIEMSHGGNR